MASGNDGGPADSRSMLAVRLHDISAGLAVGLGLLKGLDRRRGPEFGPDCDRVIEVFATVLADLKQLSADWNRARRGRQRIDLVGGLREEARRVGIDLELELVGDDDWLAADQAELLSLAGREAIRNVKRHSGAAQCRLSIDLSDCPFVLRARDWGAGLRPAAQVGDGIQSLQELASRMGCKLAIASQPGLGTELILTGHRCPHTSKKSIGQATEEAQLRSVVADKSLSSRRRVATGRPFGGSGQQIS